MSKKNMRAEMPEVAAFIDRLRKAFGEDPVNQQIRAGMKGNPVFWASENGHEIGTRETSACVAVSWDECGVSFAVDIPANTSVGDRRALIEAGRKDSAHKTLMRRRAAMNGIYSSKLKREGTGNDE